MEDRANQQLQAETYWLTIGKEARTTEVDALAHAREAGREADEAAAQTEQRRSSRLRM